MLYLFYYFSHWWKLYLNGLERRIIKDVKYKEIQPVNLELTQDSFEFNVLLFSSHFFRNKRKAYEYLKKINDQILAESKPSLPQISDRLYNDSSLKRKKVITNKFTERSDKINPISLKQIKRNLWSALVNTN